MEDPTAALLYGTLALRAAGRTPSAADLVRLAHFLGVPEPSPLLLAAVTALVEQPAGARPAPASSRLPAPEGDVPHPQLLPDPPAAPPQEERPGTPGAGLYIYGLVRSRGSALPGEWTGVDGAPVLLIEAGEFGLLAHRHAGSPFVSDEAEVVRRWVTEHDGVLARAAEHFGDVLPVAFDTIIAREGSDPAELARAWVEERSPELHAAFDRIAGAREYSVQVFWEEEQVERRLMEQEPELQQLAAEAEHQSPGKAYFIRERIRQAARQALEGERTRRVQAYRRLIEGHVRALRVENPRKGTDQGRRMIANFTCLLPPGDESRLVAALEAMQAPGESVRLAGPWVPYSFANAPVTAPAPSPPEE